MYNGINTLENPWISPPRFFFHHTSKFDKRKAPTSPQGLIQRRKSVYVSGKRHGGIKPDTSPLAYPAALSRNVQACLMRDYTIPVNQLPGYDAWQPLLKWGGCKTNQLSASSNFAYYNYKSSKRTWQGHDFDMLLSRP